jgi:acylphosphatase
MSEMKRINITVRGRVQGVFYRDSTRRKAIELGLGGTVRNRLDGAVEIVAEGPSDSLEALVLWCRTGPPAAEVTHVRTTHDEYTGEFKDFRIQY